MRRTATGPGETRRPRVLHLLASTGGGMGGMENHVMGLCRGLSPDFDVHVLTDFPYASRCPPGVSFHGADFTRSRWNPFLYRDTARCIRDLAPDIIHAHGGKAAQLLRRIRPLIPRSCTIATVHGTKTRIDDYDAMDGVIAVSAQIAGRFAPGRVRVIANGVPPAPLLEASACEALRQSLLGAHPGPLAVAIGRLAPVKGFDILIEAFRGLSARLCIIGDGEEREDLQARIDAAGLADRVVLTGYRADARSILQAADLCVLSSRREGFPLILAEALQAGCPMVSTAVSGVSGFLPDTVLAPPEDDAALHTVLAAALADLPGLRTAFAPVFKRAADELTLDGMVRATAAYYHECLDCHVS